MQKFDDGLIQGYLDVSKYHAHWYGAWQFEDWLHVAQCFPALNYKGIILGVHRGFAKLAERALKTLPEWPFYHLTGHSMGGAIALLVGYSLWREGKIVKVETAGCPRVLYAWAKHCMEDMLVSRYTTSNDPVQHLPPSPIFSHVGYHQNLPTNVPPIESHEPAVYKAFLPWCGYPDDLLY